MQDGKNNQEDGVERGMSAAPEEAGAETKSPSGSKLSGTARVLRRARGVFSTARWRLLLWAVCYMLAYLLLDNLDGFGYMLPMGYLASYLKYLVMAPVLFLIYAWLFSILKGLGLAVPAEAEGFPKVGTGVRRLGLCISLAALLYAGSAVLHEAWGWVTDLALAAAGASNAVPDWLMMPLTRVPPLLMLQGLMGLFLTHAAVAGGRRACGILSLRGAAGKLLRAQGRLLAVFLPAAMALYAAAFFFMGENGDFTLPEVLFEYGLCGLGLIFYPLSALARFMILMAQPRVALAPPAEAGPELSAGDKASCARDSRRAYLRGWGIFRPHFFQYLLWGVCYLPAAYALLLVPILRVRLLPSPLAQALPYAECVLVPVLLLMLYGWLNRLMAGQRAAYKGLLDPFRWIKTRSPGRFALILLLGMAAYACRSTVLGQLGQPLYYASQPGLTDLSFLALANYFAVPTMNDLWAQYPLLYGAAFLLLTWAMEFLFIHAVKTAGRGVLGTVHTYGVGPRILLAEARLAGLFLVLPGLLAFAVSMIPGLSPQAITAIWLAPLILLPVYHARSAITRSLLIMGQPEVALTPPAPEPPAYGELDAATRQEEAEADA